MTKVKWEIFVVSTRAWAGQERNHRLWDFEYGAWSKASRRERWRGWELLLVHEKSRNQQQLQYKVKVLWHTKRAHPHLLKIKLHTLGPWKATILYHQTKDILYFKNFLGHKKIENTLLCIQLAEVIFKEANDEFTVRVAKKPEEITQLLEVGFEFVCEKDELMYFRKRKWELT